MLSLYKAVLNHRQSFLALPGVVSLGMGIKIKYGLLTGIPSLVFGVERKLPPPAIARDQLIPRYIDRLPTDVVEIGRVFLLGLDLPSAMDTPGAEADFRKQKVRPAQPGVSIGHYRVTAGTLGAVVKGDFPEGIAILSNNHILANGTSGRDGLSFPGDAVLQPGPYDGGDSRDAIARLYSYSPIRPAKNESRGPINTIDAALAIPERRDLVINPVLGLGPVRSTASARPGMTAFISGRSSGINRGAVSSTGTTLRVESEGKYYLFENQIGIRLASKPGDSGALVVSQYGRAIGLLFAGSDKYTFANPINSVLDYFGVELNK